MTARGDEAEGQTVGVLGASGFIGQALASRLEAGGVTVVRFSRKPPPGDGWRRLDGEPDLSGLDAVVNLAGESVAQRWTPAVRERIRRSRIEVTRNIVSAIGRLDPEAGPKVLLNASATGYYGPSGEEVLTEESEAGSDFLAEVCRDWEAAAAEAEGHGLRVVLLRTGIVLGAGGEAWERMRRLFAMGLGGKLGSGRQWMPWIHLDDEVGAIEFALKTAELRGPINLTAPEPVRNIEFTRELAKALGRPAVLPAPTFGLKLVLGEFAESVLASFRVVPAKLQAAGYEFRHATVAAALAALCE